MLLHDQLRRARVEAGLSQADLAARAGIPRNQIVRAERGENITLDTLRKIVVQLPIEELSLLENFKLKVDVFPQAEKAFFGSMETVKYLTGALESALKVAMSAEEALALARREEPLPGADQAGADVKTVLLFKRLARTLEVLHGFEDTPREAHGA